MKLSYYVKQLETISDVERILLINILEIIEKSDSIVLEITQNASDYNKLIKLADDLRITSGYKSQFASLKQQLFEYGSAALLTKIVNQDKFEPRYGESFVIPLTVLPTFSSYDKLSSTSPKAYIYKKLGGTVVA
jgi:hypothetical protein